MDWYRPQTKLREGNVFTRVCLFSGRGSTIPPLGPDLPLGPDFQKEHGTRQEVTPYPLHRTTKAGGLHPTGILSC